MIFYIYKKIKYFGGIGNPDEWNKCLKLQEKGYHIYSGEMINGQYYLLLYKKITLFEKCMK